MVLFSKNCYYLFEINYIDLKKFEVFKKQNYKNMHNFVFGLVLLYFPNIIKNNCLRVFRNFYEKILNWMNCKL